MQKNCCPGQHDCSAMINFSKSLPKMQASILIFMSPCGTLAFFRSHEKLPFLNFIIDSVRDGGWRKTPLDHFLFTDIMFFLWNWKKENKDQVYIRGVGEGAPIHGLERYVPTNRVSFLMVSILKQDIFFALGGIVFAVWSLKCLLFTSSYTRNKIMTKLSCPKEYLQVYRKY